VIGGTPPYGYVWAFGDSSPNSTVEAPNHTYAGFGPYLVNVTVTDSAGSRTSNSTTILVGPPPCVSYRPLWENPLFDIGVLSIGVLAAVGLSLVQERRRHRG
jgi:hypothetical protein